MPSRQEPVSGEDRLIARFFKPLATHPGALGLSDDAAFIKPPPGCDLVLTTDAIVSGVHFFPDDPAKAVAQKAMRVNLSDLAAKGARPLGFLLSLAVPSASGDNWLGEFAEGLKTDIERFACPLFGGDTDRTPGPLSISVAMFGTVPEGAMVRRAGASVGDRVMVTGTIGDAALGLRVRRGELAELAAAHRDHLRGRYLLPQPRNDIADIVRQYASAALDVSDGLVGDLAKLCRVSGVRARIEASRVPLSEAARAAIERSPGWIDAILTGGDDYEVLCTVPSAKAAELAAAAARAGVPVADIGGVETGEGIAVFDKAGAEMNFARGSFSHF